MTTTDYNKQAIDFLTATGTEIKFRFKANDFYFNVSTCRLYINSNS